jgi:hypothetical protein
MSAQRIAKISPRSARWDQALWIDLNSNIQVVNHWRLQERCEHVGAGGKKIKQKFWDPIHWDQALWIDLNSNIQVVNHWRLQERCEHVGAGGKKIKQKFWDPHGCVASLYWGHRMLTTAQDAGIAGAYSGNRRIVA